jgi:hypothetical protein
MLAIKEDGYVSCIQRIPLQALLADIKFEPSEVENIL